MFTLVLAHVVTGLAGIVAGLVVVAGIIRRKPTSRWDALFLVMTAISCATGFVFLPEVGLTSAQLVAFFVSLLLAVAAYARYARRLDGAWNQIYAFATVGALFSGILITTAQSFLHVPALRAIAPSQHSPAYVAIKVALLLLFIAVALVTAKRAGRS